MTVRETGASGRGHSPGRDHGGPTRAGSWQPTLADYLRMLWRRRRLIIGLALVGAVVGAIVGRGEGAPRYAATVRLRVQPQVVAAEGITPVPIEAVPQEEVAAARSIAAARATVDGARVSDGVAGLLDRLLVDGDDDSGILTLTLTGSSARVGEELGTYAQSYVRVRDAELRGRVRQQLSEMAARIDDVRSELDRVSARLESGAAHQPGSDTALVIRRDTLSGLYGRLLTLRQQLLLDGGVAREVNFLSGPILNQLTPVPRGVLWIVALSCAGLLIGSAVAVAIGVLRPIIDDAGGP